MSKVVKKKYFFQYSVWSDFKPVLVMGTVLVGLHWMWFKLQQNPKLVPKEQQLTEQPIITVSTKFSIILFEILFEIQ